MSMHGYSGSNYDRFVENANNTSTFHKMKETYWTTKQVVIRKLGKKEDEHVVASDSELDAKLETFKAIQKSCMDLLRVIEKYQDRLCVVSQEENATGRFLKSHSGHDKTRAGKMMAAVGKSQSFAAQQRLALRVPLVRLYQEVETFRYRAISDTLVTINRMESARTEYRGALLWMKDVSEELDPDTYKQLEKFRKVQSQVRKTKARFDKLKLDVMQKVDLLAASRCNMFSHVLANYQATLLHFWEKTSRTMAAVAESFKGYQYYEFNMLKELAEPSLKLTEESSNREPAEKESDVDPENAKFVSNLLGDDKEEEEKEGGGRREKGEENERDAGDGPHRRHLQQPYTPHQHQRPDSPSDVDRLLSLDDDEATDALLAEQMKNRTAISSTVEQGKTETEKSQADKDTDSKKDEFGPFIDFEEEEVPEDFDFSGKIPESTPRPPRPEGPRDLLTEGVEAADDSEKDDLTLLNEILNAPSTGEDEFAQEWQAVFGSSSGSGAASQGAAGTAGAGGPGSSGSLVAELDQPRQPPTFMPSSLLDLGTAPSSADAGLGSLQPTGMSTSPGPAASSPSNSGHAKSQTKSKAKKGQKTDMSAWFNLFAELDPLSNPDAIGQPQQEQTDA